ncbi:hypothetical protein [Clostridium ragsdalei]|uniref:hypothetical protein n=1 Tax=Clostridium ragsdalei TaxID=217158 RepID=UPI001FA7F49E|nr:hypothetical protein [Clostridium ragsdalei]
MKISILLALITTVIFLIFGGILSIRKPNIVGADFYWVKYKWYYIPRYKKSTNIYYQHQIKVIGVGLIVAAVILLVFATVYVIYPPIVLMLQCFQ